MARGAEPLLEKINELADAVAALRKSFPGNIICSVPPFPHSPDHDIRSLSSVSTVGVLHQKVAETWTARIRAIDNIGLLDLDGLQRYFGVEASMDWRKWYLYRQPYSEAFWDAIGESAAALIRSQSTASKKCVVVDCDNTLWGGIIGEDGLAGIALGEDHPGSVFRDFQHQLLTLRSQGVMIALCSKNNEADVWEVFDKHDGMVLKRDDVVAARINWNDKPSNIASLAEELNIGARQLRFRRRQRDGDRACQGCAADGDQHPGSVRAAAFPQGVRLLSWFRPRQDQQRRSRPIGHDAAGTQAARSRRPS